MQCRRIETGLLRAVQMAGWSALKSTPCAWTTGWQYVLFWQQTNSPVICQYMIYEFVDIVICQ